MEIINVKHLMVIAGVILKTKYRAHGQVDRLSGRTVGYSLGLMLAGQPQCLLEKSVLKLESPTS